MNTPRTAVRLDPELVARLDLAAVEHKLSRSDLIRAMCRYGLGEDIPLIPILRKEAPKPRLARPKRPKTTPEERVAFQAARAAAKAAPPSEPNDCRHPSNRRIGSFCGACGATTRS
jgi:hypothetical protein